MRGNQSGLWGAVPPSCRPASDAATRAPEPTTTNRKKPSMMELTEDFSFCRWRVGRQQGGSGCGASRGQPARRALLLLPRRCRAPRACSASPGRLGAASRTAIGTLQCEHPSTRQPGRRGLPLGAMPTRPPSLRPSAPSPPQRRACGSSGRTCRSWPPSRAWKSWLLFVGAVPGRLCGATAPAADNQSTGCHTRRPINQAQEERLAACRFTRSFRGPRARQSRGCRGSLRARGTRPTRGVSH